MSAHRPPEMTAKDQPHRRSRRLTLGVALLLGAVAMGFAASATASRHGDSHPVAKGSAGPRPGAASGRSAPRGYAAATTANWISTWGVSPQAATAQTLSAHGFANQTIREMAFTSVGGSMLRIRLSNVYGTRPLLVGSAAVGAEGRGAALIAGSNRTLSFAGAPSVLIPPGAEVLSDPVAFTVQPLQRLAVSIFVPRATGRATQHYTGQQVNYVASGNQTTSLDGSPFLTHTTQYFFLTAIDVLAPSTDLGAVVTLGDSITDGVDSGTNTNTRWPNDLARRLAALHGSTLGVVDEGIGGNRLINNSLCCGENAVARFPRDVAERAGVREMILLEGVNDIGYSQHAGRPTAPHTDVSAAQIIAGYQSIIAQAHADGLKVFGATLTPFKGAHYWSPAGEAKREAVNNWIRTSHAFDGVIDFAKIMASPTDSQVMNPTYNSGDHLHPNAAGYKRMADSINIATLVNDA